ncbi:DUF6003 family protein [Streptomyces sp. NPDC058737]|uniref:DUF6003 family protein n=1 Tax=unclassified Streptomyces TaxID=2593676 RepID=UPI003699F99E
MAETAYLFVLPDPQTRLGAPAVAVGELECMETPAVLAWLHAHDVTAGSDLLRVLPQEADGSIPEAAERLPIPLSAEEADRVRGACAPRSTAEVEAELRAFRHTNDDRERMVSQALARGVPAHRIAQLTGLDPAEVAQIAGA